MALLTEEVVRQMSNGGTRGPVVVSRDDVLTPSARSWLREHRVEVVYPPGAGGGGRDLRSRRGIGPGIRPCSEPPWTTSRSI